MEHKLPDLPWAQDALAPAISAETIEYHYGKHHQTYINNLNNLIKGTAFENASLDDIVAKAPAGSGIYNNALQIQNHTTYWYNLTPGGSAPTPELAGALDTAFGSLDSFKEQFTKSAAALFGSGWAWLVQDGGGLAIVNTSNADSPVRDGKNVLLVCDVWEHAYYIDYRNLRPKYLEAFWQVADLAAAGKRMK